MSDEFDGEHSLSLISPFRIGLSSTQGRTHTLKSFSQKAVVIVRSKVDRKQNDLATTSMHRVRGDDDDDNDDEDDRLRRLLQLVQGATKVITLTAEADGSISVTINNKSVREDLYKFPYQLKLSEYMNFNKMLALVNAIVYFERSSTIVFCEDTTFIARMQIEMSPPPEIRSFRNVPYDAEEEVSLTVVPKEFPKYQWPIKKGKCARITNTRWAYYRTLVYWKTFMQTPKNYDLESLLQLVRTWFFGPNEDILPSEMMQAICNFIHILRAAKKQDQIGMEVMFPEQMVSRMDDLFVLSPLHPRSVVWLKKDVVGVHRRKWILSVSLDSSSSRDFASIVMSTTRASLPAVYVSIQPILPFRSCPLTILSSQMLAALQSVGEEENKKNNEWIHCMRKHLTGPEYKIVSDLQQRGADHSEIKQAIKDILGLNFSRYSSKCTRGTEMKRHKKQRRTERRISPKTQVLSHSMNLAPLEPEKPIPLDPNLDLDTLLDL